MGFMKNLDLLLNGSSEEDEEDEEEEEDFDDYSYHQNNIFNMMPTINNNHYRVQQSTASNFPTHLIRETISEASVEPEFNIKKRIVDVLNASVVSGDYCAGGKLSVDYLVPAIEILQQGTVGQYRPLPLPIVYEEQARDLIKNCSKSPFGRGEETLYDDNVRKSWQLDPEKFRITNPRWNGLIANLVHNTVKKELGIGFEKNIGFSLYKMLLYEEGGFFDFHRDTEKEEGMIATMVVQLPSSFTGGEIIVRHNERERKFECDKEATYCPYYVTFYCDCSHKVEQVTSGYRLALIYNLKYFGADKLTVVDSGNQIVEIQKIIDSWVKAPMYSKLCYILEHKYSVAGLNPTLLKGKDEIAYKLFKQLDSVTTHVAILEKHERSRGSSIYSIDETSLIYRAQVYVGEHSYSFMNLVEDEVFPAASRRLMPETSKDIENTGNEGTTIERFYKSACIIICPNQLSDLYGCYDQNHFGVLVQKYKQNPTEEKKRQLMAYTSALLVCAEDTNCETTYDLNTPALLESCIAINYLPLSLKFVERLWLGGGLRTTKHINEAVQIIKHHGIEHFKILFDKYIQKCFVSYYRSKEIEGVGTLVLELKETAWLDVAMRKIGTETYPNLDPEAIVVLLNIKEQYPSYSEKIDKIVNNFIQKELNQAYTHRFTAEMVVKLNRIDLCPMMFNNAFDSYHVTMEKVNEVLMAIKHFGIEKSAPLLKEPLSKLRVNSIGLTIGTFEQLALKNDAEGKFLAHKLFEAILKNFHKATDLSDIVKFLTFSRKHNKNEEEINMAKSIIGNINYSKPSKMHNLIQEIIKENGSECFWTGSGFRLLLEYCYKLLYGAAKSTAPLDFDLVGNSWIFTHINISCSCQYCTQVKRFLATNSTQLRLKEKLNARKHVENVLYGVLDLQQETIKSGSPQTLQLTKVMKTAESKKAALGSLETILNQYIQYATLSDQKPNARPVEQSSSTSSSSEPPTKKVKQETQQQPLL